MLIKIIFDTNILRANDLSMVKSIKDFLHKHKHGNSHRVQLCVPEIVLKEWGQYHKNQIRTINKKAKGTLKQLESYGHSKIDLEEINPDTYARNTIKSFLKDFSIGTIPIPKLNQEELIERAILKTPPFNESKEADPGFKDTILFLSLKEDSMKYTAKEVLYILVTNDSDFDKTVSEFNKNDRELLIRREVSKVHDELDTRLELGLDRAKNRQELEEIILQRRDVFDLYLLTRMTDKKDIFSSLNGSDIDHYSFDSFLIDSFESITENKFKVIGRIIADITYKETDNNSRNTGTPWRVKVGPYYNEPYRMMTSSDDDCDSYLVNTTGLSFGKETHEAICVTLELDIEKRGARIL